MGKASRNRRKRQREAGPGRRRAGQQPSSAVATVAAKPDLRGRIFGGDGPWFLALFLLVAVFYFPATRAGFVWDDIIVATSTAVSSWSGLWQLWFETDTTYHPDNTAEGHFWPIVYTTFWLEHKLWGFAPLGYHLTNLLLHFANCWLIWRLLRRLAVPGAWLAAAVFAAHPVHVEAVVWVIARKDLLSTLFYLLAALAWLRHLDAPAPWRHVGALAAYAAAILSKTIAASLPVALLAACWWRNGRVTGGDVARLLPFFALGLALGLHDTLFYQARESAAFDYSIFDRALIASRALWFYLGKLLWPVDLAVIYPRWEIDAAAPAAWLWPAALLAAAALLWRFRRRLGGGPPAGALFFAVTLAPALGLVDNTYMQWSFVADRYQYLASLGVIAVLAGLATHAMRDSAGAARFGAHGAAGVLLLTLGVLSWRQAGVYEDNIVFNSHIVALNPSARDAHLNLGAALSDAGRHEEALAAAREAIKLRPDAPRPYANAGRALIDLGRHDEAEQVLRRGIANATGNRGMSNRVYADASLTLNLAAALERQERFDESLAAYDELLAAEPDHGAGLIGRGGLLLRMGRAGETLAFLEQGLDLLAETAPQTSGPDFQRARMRMQMSLAARDLGRIEEAAAHRRITLENVPDAPGPPQDVAESLRADGRLPEAIAWYAVAIERDPEFAVAYAGMGDALFAMGRYEDAMAQLDQAEALLSADSELAPALRRLVARTRAAQGDAAAAVAAYRRLLELVPNDAMALRELVSLHFDQGQYESALEILENLAQAAPADAEIQVNIGVVLHALGRSREALARFDQALALDPASAAALSNRALVRQSLRMDTAPRADR